jgi:hypothetical protein
MRRRGRVGRGATVPSRSCAAIAASHRLTGSVTPHHLAAMAATRGVTPPHGYIVRKSTGLAHVSRRTVSLLPHGIIILTARSTG